jgi:hypothetical protein
MASIIKVDQIQSDTGAVNVSSNLQFSSGFTMLSPTLTTPTLSSPTLTTPTTSGVMTLGAGIKFSATQVSSADANTLDDYEEGTFTATMTVASGTITLSSSIDLMQYTKIGRLVTLTGRVNIASVSSPSGSIYFNLPFATQSGSDEQAGYHAFACYTHGVNLTDTCKFTFWEVGNGLGYATLFQIRDNDSWLALNGNQLTGSGNEYIYITGSYITN